MSRAPAESTGGYTPSEMMIVAAARSLAGVRTVFVGVGLPNIACNLAQRTVAPDLQLIYESGVFGARPARLPLSIGDPTLASGAISTVSMADLFGLYLQRGLVEVGLLGGAQIDRYGNLNTTVIGQYDKPTVRLPGSGGACEIAIDAQRTFMIMRLKKRAFVERLDFRTSPGHMGNGDMRRQLAMPGAGPQLVITDMALFDFADGGEMRLTALYPGASPEAVRAEIGWEVRVADVLTSVQPPTERELRIIREELTMPSGQSAE
jgi:glutaconate CoA-transferase, subunit B